MNAEYPTAEIAATPEYVLEVFRDVFREWGQDADALTFDTRVSDFAAEWNDTILFWREFARSLDEFTRLDLPVEEWRPVLRPMRRRTVGDVCRFVAQRMGTRPTVRPWRHVGGECLPAGAFLTARARLVELGADPAAVTPSAPLREFLLRFGPGWVVELARTAPGRLPPIEMRYALQSCGRACVALGLGLPVFGSVFARPAVFGCGGALFLAAALVIGLLNGLLPYRFRLGELNTFRDLAYALAGQRPRRAIQPTA